MLPQLRRLEQQFPSQLAVIGVHSGKYHAERVTERIRHASSRLGAVHPIVNDRQFRIWRSYAVSAWPTIAVLDESGYVVGMHAGEFTSEMVAPFIASLIASAETRGTLIQTPWPTANEPHNLSSSRLYYPGKLTLDGMNIAIADSGNNRVLLGKLSSDGQTMIVTREIGGGREGYADGENASFNSPQGLSFSHDTLYVADAANHAIRAIDRESGVVTTVAGIGTQLRTKKERDQGALSSPWDIEVHNEKMYIAMAGVHQLWSVGLATQQLAVHAGTGAEDIHDGPNRDAVLAQPMGITSSDSSLYFADAESSAIRSSDFIHHGLTRTIVGTGLFDFGDVDGIGDDVRMQHPQGLAVAPDGRLLVTDSYNDSLKWIDPATRSARTWITGLHEPSGVACGKEHAYVADTNAHRIVTVHYETGTMNELRLL